MAPRSSSEVTMQDELTRQQLISTYLSAMKVSEVGLSMPPPIQQASSDSMGDQLPVTVVSPFGGAYVVSLKTARMETDFDSYFRKLEERFAAVDVKPEYKVAITRRLLSGPHLKAWIELSSDQHPENKTYEDVRDAMIKHNFPSSNLYETLMQALTKPRAPEPAVSDPATPAPTEGTEDENGPKDANKPPGTMPRNRGTSTLANIRNQAETYRDAMSRVSKRAGKPMPEEEVWIKWATNLMRPSLIETVQTLESVPTTLHELLNVLMDTPAAIEERRIYGRRSNKNKSGSRSNRTKRNPVTTNKDQSARTVASTGSAAGTPNAETKQQAKQTTSTTTTNIQAPPTTTTTTATAPKVAAV